MNRKGSHLLRGRGWMGEGGFVYLPHNGNKGYEKYYYCTAKQ